MKRIVCVLLCISMLLSCKALCVSAVYYDAADTRAEYISGLLSVPGIMPDGYAAGANPDSLLTRSEYLLLVMSAKGYKVDAQTAEISYFSDVPAGTLEAAYTNVAVDLGFVSGYGDGLFGPKDKISINESIKLAVSVAGYGFMADSYGGYPAGFVMVAQQKDITDGLGGDFDRPISAGDAELLIYNMLHADWVHSYTVNGEVRYTIDPDKNILSEVHRIYRETGIITGVEETRLSNGEGVAKGFLEVNGKTYKMRDETDKRLLGYHVDLYYTSDKNTGLSTAVYISVSEQNADAKYESGEIIEFKDNKYSFKDEMKSGSGETLMSVSKSADIIYNGRALLDLRNEGVFTPKSGSVILIDNNKDGLADVVKIRDSKVMLVESVSQKDKIIYDRLSDDAPSLVDADFVTIEDDHEQTMDFNDIASNDIVDFAISADGKVVDIVLSRSVITGVLQQIREQEMTYVVNSVSYRLTDAFTAYLKKTGTALTLGQKYNFYLSPSGELAGISTEAVSDEEGKYGCLITAAPAKDFDKTVQFKMLTEEGNIEILKSARYMQLDGVSKLNGEKVFAVLEPMLFQAVLDDRVMTPIVVYYKLDAEGKVNYMETPNAALSSTSDMALHKTASVSKEQYSNANRSIGGALNVDDSTIVFSIPANANEADSKKFRVRKAADSFINATEYSAVGYSRERHAVISQAMLMTASAGADADWSMRIFMLQDIVRTAVSEFDIRYALCGIENNEDVSYVVSEDEVLQNLQPTFNEGSYDFPDLGVGDILQLAIDEYNEIQAIRMIYSASEDEFYIPNNPTTTYYIPWPTPTGDVTTLKNYYNPPNNARSQFVSSRQRIYVANVYYKSDSHIQVINPVFDLTDSRVHDLVKSGEIKLENHLVTDSNVYVFDPDGKVPYSSGDMGSITSWVGQGNSSRVMIFTSAGITTAIVVLPN